MRALVAHAAGDFRLTDVPVPPLPPGGCLLAVEATGVCAADRMIWRGDGPWPLSFPFVPGHELLGRVTASERPDVPVGRRVTAEVLVPCGRCPACRSGRTNLCRSGTHVGSGIPGGFADVVALPAGARVHRVPGGLPTAAAVLAEPMACAVHAVRRCGLRPDDVLAIAGIGAIGACALVVARGRCRRVVAVVRSAAAKEKVARALGADEVVGTNEIPDVDVFLDCSGASEVVVAGLRAVVPGGRLVLDGVYRTPAVLDLNEIAEFKELEVRGVHLAPGAFPTALRLLGRPEVAGIVTEVRPLADFAAALEPAPRLKAVLVP